MPIWKLEPKKQNNVVELQFWTRGSDTLSKKELFANASFLSDFPTRPVIDTNNPTGYHATASEYNWNLERLDARPGGPWISWTFPLSISDIEKELKHYKEHLRGKIIFCNCDDPEESHFWKYFSESRSCTSNCRVKYFICVRCF